MPKTESWVTDPASATTPDAAAGSPASLAGILPALAPLLLGYAALQAGNALQGSLLGVAAQASGFSAFEAGLIASGFWCGVIAGSPLTRRLIERVGHVRTFAALASIASASAPAHLLLTAPVAWIVTRAVTGACFAGLFVSCESWFNAATTRSTRGRAFAVYAMTGLAAGLVGQPMLSAADPTGYVLFCVVSVAISLSLVPMALARVDAPAVVLAPDASPDLGWAELARRTPFAVAGALLAGASLFYGLGAYYAVGVGMSPMGTAAFMAAASLGALIVTWPLGRLSDRMDRRVVVVACSGCAVVLLTISAVMLPEPRGLPWAAHAGFALLFGILILPGYGLIAAHAGDRMRPGEHVAAAGSLLVLYAVGSAAGPLLGGVALRLAGDMAFSALMAAAQAGLVAVGVWRMLAERAPRSSRKARFVPTPVTPALLTQRTR